MAVLKKPYELSLWRDIWDDTNQWFDEQKICVIGSNDMLSQSRAIEPTLTRNVNGSKKLTFKMYKKYIDTITGETVHNPFVDMLVSESKIKLNYNGKWFDFIIKNIVENSSTHLCTYQLEDAFVNELSKNGFNKVLSSDLTNNMGDVNTLASNLLDETDWRVGPTSEKIVQTVEDALVYVIIPAGTRVYHLLDQRENDRTSGVTVENEAGETLKKEITALAFYTSCKNKPHRFQFIYSDKGYFTEDGEPLLSRDQERVITESDCQYYCEIDDPATYTVTQHNMFLPTGWSFFSQAKDELISSLYRGDRYGFAQQSKYIPEIDRYVYLYKNNKDGKTYYGYQYNKYTSATTISDIISNSGFKGSSGWVGHTTESIAELDESGNVRKDADGNSIKKDGVNKATVESVYGRFNPSNGNFIGLTDDLQNNDYKPDDPQREYRSYLKFSFENNSENKEQIVLNSGPYDHRYSIKEMPAGSLWAVRCVDQNGTSLIGNNNLTFELAEYSYNTDTDFLCYQKSDEFSAVLATNDEIYKTETVDGVTYYFFEVETNNHTTETAFTKNSEVRLAIKANDSTNATYYIKEIELFRALYTKDATPKLLIPNEKHIDDVVDDIKNQITFSEYRYFTKDAVKGITSEKDLEFTGVETLTYKEFKPVYNAEAEKIRSVEEKESNYFNILQSLAETFECWLDIEVGRDTTGKIKRRDDDNTLDKNIVFKNYVGQKNYASFRYGVNLKDIQRTYESKNIVTKLVVKTNANEHAPNGFCTIQRAGANTTGENYLYDFGYYHNMGMLDAESYLSIIQDTTDNDEWKGPDLGDPTEINLKGYNVRISNLNKAIQEENEKLVGLAQDITNVSAQKKTAEAMLDAANTGIVEVEADYERVAKQHITATLTSELLDRDDVKSLLVEYGTYISERDKQEVLVTKYAKQSDTLKKEYARLEGLVKDKLEHKKALNTKFYNTYSRFIQEGTWVDEEYIDDDKYYNDAKSVLYNSCYPQVAYSVNVLALSMLPGYELLDFDLGDQTNVVDPEFFGEQFQEEVVVTETVEPLDDPTKNTIKVQNFKNQFQDLFQKITATAQQAQYSTGAYQKAVSLAYAENQTKMEFLNDALGSAGAMLTAAGQQSVTWGDEGITVTDVDTPCNELRMVGGAILLSKQDEKTGQKKWVSAVTSDGISANLVTAGVVNTGKVAIMNGNEENFLWDANGINAFGDKVVKTDNSVERSFVRFDKYGLYGIKDKDGAVYRADSLDAIMRDATFALTWEGLKVTGDDGVTARIGRLDGNILKVSKGSTDLLKITNSGNLEMTGIIHATGGDFSGNITATGTITGGTIVGSEIKNDSYGSIFKLNGSGGKIAGWEIGTNALHTSNNSLYLGSAGITAKIGAVSRDNLVFKAGDNFGVAADGTVYATKGKIGTVEITKVASTDTTDELNDLILEANELIAEVNDSKAESFYQNTDPADYDGDDAWGENEKGNLWYCTTDEEDEIDGQVSTADTSTIKRKKNGEYIWTDITSEIEVEGEEQKQTLVGYGWKEKDIPSIVFDAYDGRATIFTGDATKQEYPTHYKVGDFWILPEAATINVKKCKKNAILSSSSDSEDFDATHWSEIDYTNDDAAIAAQGTANEAKEGLNDKLDLTNKNNNATGFRYLWANNGLSIWDKNLDSTSPETPNEKNTIFTIYQNTDKKYQLKMKGSGEFTGTITAQDGYIGNLLIKDGAITTANASSGNNQVTGLKITTEDIEVAKLQVGGLRFGKYSSFWEQPNANNAPDNMLAHWHYKTDYGTWQYFFALTNSSLQLHIFEGQDGKDEEPFSVDLKDFVNWGCGKIVDQSSNSPIRKDYNIFEECMTGWISYMIDNSILGYTRENLLFVNGIVCAKNQEKDFDPVNDTEHNAGINWWLGTKEIQWN